MQRLLSTLGLVALVTTMPIAAVPLTGLYTAAVPVSDTSPESRPAAYSRALARVLTRVTGARGIAQADAAAPLLENAEQFVQQYTYHDDGQLWVAFDGRALQNALAAAGLPVWGADRPEVLIWLAVDYGRGARRLVGADDGGSAQRAVDAIAKERGVPIVWPLLDTQDRGNIALADVWGGFETKIRDASRRYGADATLVARLSRGAGNRLYGRWQLTSGGENITFEGGIRDGMHAVADYFGGRLAMQAGGDAAQSLLIEVDGIRDVESYARTLSYLEKLTASERVQVEFMADSTVFFRVSTRGDASRLAAAIEVGRVLVPVSDGPEVSGLRYRYAR